jgi:hypothetical protein
LIGLRVNPVTRRPETHRSLGTLLRLSVLSALAATGFACQTSDPASTLTPVPAVPVPITETFNGTVAVGQSDVHPFTVTISGTVSVTLTAAGPPPTITMGVGIGSPTFTGSVTTCVLLTNGSTNTPPGPTPQLSGSLIAGSYCIAVFDVGNETAPVGYTVTVTHS